MNFLLVIFMACFIYPVFNVKKDVVFLVDTSISVGAKHCTHALGFIINVTRFLNIDNQNVIISVVLFDKQPLDIVTFNSSQTNVSLERDIQRINCSSNKPYTNTALALEHSLSLFNTSRNGAKKAVVVLTDGDSDDRVNTTRRANDLRNHRVSVYGIAIGSKVSQTLISEFAGGDSNVLRTSDFLYLCNQIPRLVAIIDPAVLNANKGINCPQETTTTITRLFTTARQVSAVPHSATAKDGNKGLIAGVASACGLLALLLLLFALLRKKMRKKTEPKELITGQPPIKTAF